MYQDPSGLFAITTFLAITLSTTAISMWGSNISQAKADDRAWYDWREVDTKKTMTAGTTTAITTTAILGTGGKSALVKGIGWGFAGKYTEDVTYNYLDGKSGLDLFKPNSSFGDYTASIQTNAFTNSFGGKGLLPSIGRAAGDAVMKPALKQVYDYSNGVRSEFDRDKLFDDATLRFGTSLVPIVRDVPRAQSTILRGTLRGVARDTEEKNPGHLSFWGR